ncbi:MAG: metallophosphoesterase family protein [Zoogloeaceae bacterium]|nr:metallophosphoesterase family protein [Zoogloeaceae bacterium]
MKLHILSDIHLEFSSWPRQVDINAIDADLTILAGDSGVGLEGVMWALSAIRRPVVYVCGNHEHYGQRTMPKLLAAARKKCSGTHVHFLENDAVAINGVRFLGCTVWTRSSTFAIGSNCRGTTPSSPCRPIRRIGRRPSLAACTLGWNRRSRPL